MCLRLIAETDARSVGDSHPSCFLYFLVGFCRVYLSVVIPSKGSLQYSIVILLRRVDRSLWRAKLHVATHSNAMQYSHERRVACDALVLMKHAAT